MKIVLCAFLLSIGLANTAIAALEEGVAAYEKKDFSTALKEWLPLAESGNADAMTLLGIAYVDDIAVPRNFEEAIKWLRLAADKKHPIASGLLGSAYANGEGVQKNYGEAVRWHRLAAEQGNADSQFSLGFMYQKWQGVSSRLQRGCQVVSPSCGARKLNCPK